ncbi:MAG TPA: sodium:proton antiporter [Phycisphaerales bacterium]|nr:sodium:proton antiporter [Phycisphaerales bacterium]
MIVAGLCFMVLGLLFFLGTVLGVHRFPDCYTRMHGAAKGDTLSSILFITGIILVSFEHFGVADAVRTAKLLFIIVFLFVASPAASHALVAAGYANGLKPWQRRKADTGQTEEEATS